MQRNTAIAQFDKLIIVFLKKQTLQWSNGTTLPSPNKSRNVFLVKNKHRYKYMEYCELKTCRLVFCQWVSALKDVIQSCLYLSIIIGFKSLPAAPALRLVAAADVYPRCFMGRPQPLASPLTPTNNLDLSLHHAKIYRRSCHSTDASRPSAKLKTEGS